MASANRSTSTPGRGMYTPTRLMASRAKSVRNLPGRSPPKKSPMPGGSSVLAVTDDFPPVASIATLPSDVSGVNSEQSWNMCSAYSFSTPVWLRPSSVSRAQRACAACAPGYHSDSSTLWRSARPSGSKGCADCRVGTSASTAELKGSKSDLRPEAATIATGAGTRSTSIEAAIKREDVGAPARLECHKANPSPAKTLATMVRPWLQVGGTAWAVAIVSCSGSWTASVIANSGPAVLLRGSCIWAACLRLPVAGSPTGWALTCVTGAAA
mmetsp:Transcript_30577/g.51662  ORF Transcript_30577/g.51662 Transcript_30577/m.51662 type:complete len:269 (+) Transcript_30577:2502-3308(+)